VTIGSIFGQNGLIGPALPEGAAVRITLAQAMGTCFGVQDAIDMALDPDFKNRLTVVGQLVHNPQTMERLKANGVRIVERDQIDSITTDSVMITAHGAADATRADLLRRGFMVYDATCPLVIRLHKLARFLERQGYFPVIVGEATHVEVRGVVGNLKASAVVNDESDLAALAGHSRIGVVSQTTNRLEKVRVLVDAIRALPWVDDVRFIDTICQPVKERQQAIGDLLAVDIDLGIVIGGNNSANTRKLLELIRDKGIEAYHIERAEELDPTWFTGKHHVGITAGTSTPQDVIESVHAAVKRLSVEVAAP
jgi:4-hydroxy-3-methylbut-2-en-1-yl diphosphate reductase